LLLESFVTVALSTRLLFATTFAVVWESVTAIAGTGDAVIVITAAAVFVRSATEVAVSVTLAGLGTDAGAV
jgi:hypothetical protein